MPVLENVAMVEGANSRPTADIVTGPASARRVAGFLIGRHVDGTFAAFRSCREC